MHLKMAYIWCCTFISARQDGPILDHLGRVVRHLFSSIAKFLFWLAEKTHDIHENLSIFNSAPDNVRTAVNYGSGLSKYGLIVKTASIEYGCFSADMVRLFR